LVFSSLKPLSLSVSSSSASYRSSTLSVAPQGSVYAALRVAQRRPASVLYGKHPICHHQIINHLQLCEFRSATTIVNLVSSDLPPTSILCPPLDSAL
ncbi:hypothetical protein PIB30_049621, partial [Stylosanthes scabra]|nr:hypothetical protein [Stylosanthes scabra]